MNARPSAAPTGLKVFTAGTHRVRPPAETWELVRRRLPEYGITRVADVTGLDVIGIPVAVAVRPLSRSLSVSQGKGHTPLLARVSAAMESIEMWHAEFACPPAVHHRTPASALRPPYALDLLDRHPGSLLHDGTPLDWVTATGTLGGARVPVPRDCVRLGSSRPGHWRPPGLTVTSNGLASGNTFEEAALHAAYEVMERDALSRLAAVPGDPRVTFRAETVEDPLCTELIERVTRGGVFLDLALVPNRWGLPCFAAFVWSEDFALLTAGSGAHSSPGVALARAITEAVQSRLTLINGTRDDVTAVYAHARRGVTARPRRDPGARAHHELPAATTPDFTDVGVELRWACARLAEVTGQEPLVVDLGTTEDFSVVKLIAPGLRAGARHAVPRPDHPEHRPERPPGPPAR
ncbi:YcaO-like family protein [Streptomyces sp. NPDC048606]|uniref:YcaO-like family protein n=1 Tax=Streptomyces sp. NPDC048606 TaxID=3154726 RepID=UPI00343992A5